MISSSVFSSLILPPSLPAPLWPAPKLPGRVGRPPSWDPLCPERGLAHPAERTPHVLRGGLSRGAHPVRVPSHGGETWAAGGTLERIPAANVLRELRQVASLGLSVPICAVGASRHSTCPEATSSPKTKNFVLRVRPASRTPGNEHLTLAPALPPPHTT